MKSKALHGGGKNHQPEKYLATDIVDSNPKEK